MYRVSMKPDQDQQRSYADRALVARLLAALRGGQDVRSRKVRRLRGAVRATAYENPLKIHVAVERLAEELNGSDDPQ